MWLSRYPRRCSWIYWRVKVSTPTSRCDTNINEVYSNTKKKRLVVFFQMFMLYFSNSLT